MFIQQSTQCCLSTCPLLNLFVAFSLLVYFSTGAEKLTKGTHSISGIKLRVTVGQVPVPSQPQQAISFPSAYSTASQVMQPPPHVLPQQARQSATPVPVPRPRTKKHTSSLGTDEASVLSIAAQGLSLATAEVDHPSSHADDSTNETGRQESFPVDVGSPVPDTSQSTPTHSTPPHTSSIVSESMTPMSPVVRVVGILPEWDEDMLSLAFDDEEEGGGEIEENGIHIKGNEALITFKDPDGKCNFPHHLCIVHSLNIMTMQQPLVLLHLTIRHTINRG